MRTGKLYGLGVGPGDPELITLKALRLLRAAPVVAYYASKRARGNAFTTVEGYLSEAQTRVPLIYPVTGRPPPPPFDYEATMRAFYDESARRLAAHLDAGRDVAVIAEGDPLFYSSFMYLHDRLAGRYASEVVPGICAPLAGAARAAQALVYRDQVLTVLVGTLDEAELQRRLADAPAAVIMKLGSHFAKVQRVIERLGLGARACYVERATMADEYICPLLEVDPQRVPYFAMVLVPGRRWGES